LGITIEPETLHRMFRRLVFWLRIQKNIEQQYRFVLSNHGIITMTTKRTPIMIPWSQKPKS